MGVFCFPESKIHVYTVYTNLQPNKIVKIHKKHNYLTNMGIILTFAALIKVKRHYPFE